MDAMSLEELISRITLEPALRPRLVEALMASKVAVPLNKGLENGVLPADFKPLTLHAQEGFPILAVFTTPDKAAPWFKQQPDFKHALVTDFAWAIGITRPPFGIAVNPGYRYSLLLAPDEVEALRSAA